MRYAILIAMLMCLPARGEAWQLVGGGGAASAPNYTVASCSLYVANADGSAKESKMGLYDSTGALIASTAAVTIGTTGFPKVISHPIAGGPTLTPGGRYYISSAANGYINTLSGGATWKNRYNLYSSWPTLPASITPTTDTTASYSEILMYCSNSAGQTLLNSSDTTNYTTTAGRSSDKVNMYFRDGYLCNTL